MMAKERRRATSRWSAGEGVEKEETDIGGREGYRVVRGGSSPEGWDEMETTGRISAGIHMFFMEGWIGF
jgi:hypothetical protein